MEQNNEGQAPKEPNAPLSDEGFQEAQKLAGHYRSAISESEREAFSSFVQENTKHPLGKIVAEYLTRRDAKTRGESDPGGSF